MAQKDKVVEARGAVVVLGGREFTVKALPMGAARKWRKKFGEPLQAIIGILQNADKIKLDGVADAAALLQQVGGMLLGSIDTLVAALFDYSPALRQEKEWIEANAMDEEAISALWEVLKLAYPFGNLVSLVKRGAATIGK